MRYYSKREVITLHAGFSKIVIKPVAFAFLPKTLIFLPGPLEALYRNGLANPFNRLMERVLPASMKPYFAVHYDIIATR